MADRYLLQSGAPDGYLLEDGTGVLILDTTLYRSMVIADGASAYWRLGDTAGTMAVEEIASRHGTYVNAPTLAQPGAIVADANTAVSFVTASSQLVTLPGSTIFDVNGVARSFECWFNRASGSGTLIAHSVLGGGATALSITGLNARWFHEDFGAVVFDVNPALVSTTGQWHHIVATSDESIDQARLWFDGTLIGTDLTWAGSAVPVVAGTFTIGDGIEGLVDEVAVYPTVLTPAQIVNHYRVGRTELLSIRVSPYPQLLAH